MHYHSRKTYFSSPNGTGCFTIRRRGDPIMLHIVPQWPFCSSTGSRCRSQKTMVITFSADTHSLRLFGAISSNKVLCFDYFLASGVYQWIQVSAGSQNDIENTSDYHDWVAILSIKAFFDFTYLFRKQ